MPASALELLAGGNARDALLDAGGDADLLGLADDTQISIGRPQGLEAGFDPSVSAGDRRVGAAGRPQRDVEGDSSHGADAGLGLGPFGLRSRS